MREDGQLFVLRDESQPGINLVETIAFLAKKTLSVFVHPLGFSLLLIIVGMILWRTRRKLRLGIALVLTGTLILIILGSPITAYVLLNHLESKAGPYVDPKELRRQGVQHIIVLGGTVVMQKGTPSDRYGESILRVMEGVRLWRALPDSTLVLSAGSSPALKSNPQAMADLPIELGVPKDAMIMETRAQDTEDEAKLFTKIVKHEPFALVTSALHIPRSLALFRSKGLSPIPCPCDFRSLIKPPIASWVRINAGSLRYSELVVHEYVGMLWFRLKHLLVY